MGILANSDKRRERCCFSGRVAVSHRATRHGADAVIPAPHRRDILFLLTSISGRTRTSRPKHRNREAYSNRHRARPKRSCKGDFPAEGRNLCPRKSTLKPDEPSFSHSGLRRQRERNARLQVWPKRSMSSTVTMAGDEGNESDWTLRRGPPPRRASVPARLKKSCEDARPTKNDLPIFRWWPEQCGRAHNRGLLRSFHLDPIASVRIG